MSSRAPKKFGRHGAHRVSASGVLAAIIQAAGCAQSTAPPAATTFPGAAVYQEKQVGDEVLRFRETTSPTLSNQQVGISNIFKRDLPDDKGVIAPRMSAVLVFFDAATSQSRRQTVAAGSVVAIGADRYYVVSVEEGKNAPGWLSLQKLTP